MNVARKKQEVEHVYVKHCEGCQRLASQQAEIEKNLEMPVGSDEFGKGAKEKVLLALTRHTQCLEQKVIGIVDRNLTEIVAGVLGFRHSFGRWEPDACNGRTSLASIQISDRARKHAELMLDMFLVTDVGIFLENDDMAQIKASAKESFKRELRNQVSKQLHDQAMQLARETAQKIVNEAVAEATMKKD